MILRFPSLCALAMLLIGACQSKNDLSIAPFPENKSAALSLTFDDGCITGLTKISPLLREYDITGTFFLNPVFISQDSIWEQWRILANQGFEIGNHGYSHISLENIVDDSVLQFEVERSRETIEQRVDKRVISFAHPYDRSNIIADSVVLKNHIASRIIPDRKSLKLAMDSKTSFENINSFISKVIKRQRMSCVSIHGIDNDCWEPISMQTFTHLLNTIQKNKDELFVDTFGNLAKYDTERKSSDLIVYELEEKITFKIVNNLDKNIFNYPLTVVLKPRKKIKSIVGNCTWKKEASTYTVTVSPDVPVTVYYDDK